MSVIAFRPRRQVPSSDCTDSPVLLSGRFRSPTGRMGSMDGSLRPERLVLAPRGAFVAGVITGRLLDIDGSLVGMDSRRSRLAAHLVREAIGYVPVVRGFQVVLMGIVVDVGEARMSGPIVPAWPEDAPPLGEFHRRDRRELPGIR